jgi:HAD superfamily hydrolase (TIGR01549 family)
LLTHKLLGVIFDLDNTLVTSSLNFNKIRHSLGCPKEKDLLDFIDELPFGQQLSAKNLLINYETADALSAKKFDGTDELLTLLSLSEIACAIVTRNCQQAALIKVKNNGIDIPIVISREDHRAKPAPDALLHLAKYWKTPPENLLYVGDYLYDLQAANNANTMSCLVTHGQTLEYADLASIVVTDLGELTHFIEEVLFAENKGVENVDVKRHFKVTVKNDAYYTG